MNAVSCQAPVLEDVFERLTTRWSKGGGRNRGHSPTYWYGM